MPFLEVDKLRKSYKTGKSITHAVDGISFSAERSQILGILGPNGSGKTTTIKSILGLIKFDYGSISVAGFDVANQNHKVLQNCSAVLEGARNTHWRLTPAENMDYFAGIKGYSPKQIKHRKEQLVEKLGLESMLKKEVGQLSRGYQQRVAIASALISSPDMVLLDEPTLGLDVESISKMRELIDEYAMENKLIIITSHDMKFIESVCQQIILFKNGKILRSGTTSSFKSILKQKSLSLSLNTMPAKDQLDELRKKFRIQNFENRERNSLNFLMDNETELYKIIHEMETMGVTIMDIKFNHNDLENIFLYLIGRAESVSIE